MGRLSKLSGFILFAIAAVACGQGITPSAGSENRILIFGDSIAAAYGLRPEEGFGALIADRIKGTELPYTVAVEGQSGDTSGGGVGRIHSLLDNPIAVLILELGANDAFRRVDPDDMERNLQEVIDSVRERNPGVKILLLGMEAPPHNGADYRTRFRAAFARLAAKNNTAFVPFFLEGVAGSRTLNLPDGIHPTAKGHERIAELVWDSLRPLL